MPLISTNTRLLIVDSAYIAESGYQKKWDAIKDHPLGANIGTRAINEMSGEWYKLALDISWFERETLTAKSSMVVKMSGRTLQRKAANGDLATGDGLDIPVEEQNEAAMKRLRYMETYIKEWSHSAGKPPTEDLKRLTPITAWALQEIIADIHKGQALKADSPLAVSKVVSCGVCMATG